MKSAIVGLLLLIASPLWAQTEKLTLTTPETQSIAAQWQVTALHIDVAAPNIEVTLISDQQKTFVWRYVVTGEGVVPVVTRADVIAAILFINRGDFRPLGKTLNQWILERINAFGVKIGTVTP